MSDSVMQEDSQHSRRWFLVKLGAALNAVIGVAVAIPIVRYFLGPVDKDGYLKWISLGSADQFPVGETRLAEFLSPSGHPWDGLTKKTSCWVRRTAETKFQVFAINCAHLGCPVRWFPQSGLFLCPCHGGAYYADGSRASGPPERALFEYPYKLENGELIIEAGQLPTLANTTAKLVQIDSSTKGKGGCSCAG